MHERKIIKRLIVQVSAGIILFVCVFLFFIFWLPNSFEPSPQFVTVSKGQNFSSVADSLEQKGILASRFTFKFAARLLHADQKMKVGKYSFASGVTNFRILKDFEEGNSVKTNITFREGIRAKMYAHFLKKNIAVDSARFMSFFTDTSFIGIHPHNSSSLEGYLMPDTYSFGWQDDEMQIIQTLLAEFRKFFVDSLQRRMKELNFDLNEVLTMASIVEGEAVHDDERPVIAGVYYNRIKIRMPLQADPTIQYIVADTPRRILHKDLQVKSPYNTYKNYGLPPGPINNPGRQSILAALYPAKHNYLYFVSDYNGRHRFSRSYSEHLKNVRLYRKARTANNSQSLSILFP